MYTNGHAYTNRRTGKYHTRNDDIRLPDEQWVVAGDSDIEASVWIAPEGSSNAGQQFMALHRVVDKDDGVKKLKTFRKSDIRGFFLGLAEHCARLSEQEDLADDERDVFAQLAEGTVELLDQTPLVESVKRKPRRKKRNRRS